MNARNLKIVIQSGDKSDTPKTLEIAPEENLTVFGYDGKEILSVQGTPKIGAVIGPDTYMGIWEPKDENGKSYKKSFNLYARHSRDPIIPSVLDPNKTFCKEFVSKCFNDLARKCSSYPLFENLRDWPISKPVGILQKLGNKFNCFAGPDLSYEQMLYRRILSMKPGERSKYFIPPLELVNGFNGTGKKVQPDNILDNKPCLLELVEAGSSRFAFTCTERRDEALPGQPSDRAYVVGDKDAIANTFYDRRTDTTGYTTDYNEGSLIPFRVEMRP